MIIYTTADYLKLYDNIDIRSYNELDPEFVKWVDDTTIKLYNKRTFAEIKFAEIMKQQPYKVYEQCFFRIGGKSYFLDFFMPDFNIAFELNGTAHQGGKAEAHDIVRDFAFMDIGIITIRLSNRDVYRENIKELLNSKFRDAMTGKHDLYDFYRIPNINKYHGKLTTNQRGIVLAIKKLINVPDNSSVLIETNMAYLVCVLNGVDTEFYDNKAYLDDYYATVKSKNLGVNVVYNGDIRKVWYMLYDKMKENADKAKGKVFDHTITINGCEVKNVKDKAK